MPIKLAQFNHLLTDLTHSLDIVGKLGEAAIGSRSRGRRGSLLVPPGVQNVALVAAKLGHGHSGVVRLDVTHDVRLRSVVVRGGARLSRAKFAYRL